MKKVALYFGSFNPLHYGHLAVAEYVILNCNIDSFEMVLSPHNPFKDKKMLEEPKNRLTSLRKAINEFNKSLLLKIEEKNRLLAEKERRLDQQKGESLLRLSNIRCKGVKVNDIEFHLKEPLYTFNTMKELQKRNPDTEFLIVVGADSMKIMPKWYLGENILKEFKVIVYPRKGYRVKTLCRKYKALYLEEAPLNNISSTQIRSGETY